MAQPAAKTRGSSASLSDHLQRLKALPHAASVSFCDDVEKSGVGQGFVFLPENDTKFPCAPPLNITLWQEKPPPGCKPKKTPGCGLVQGSVTIKTYGTLRVAGVSHMAGTVLTCRGVQDLPGQLRFDETYVEHMRKRGLERGRYVNAALGEWLFGFPRDYTRNAANDDAAAAAEVPAASSGESAAVELPPAKRRRLRRKSAVPAPAISPAPSPSSALAAAAARGSRLPAASVFSGCDGLARGLEDWIDVRSYCESDPVPRSLLEDKIKRGLLGPARVEPDVCTLRGEQLRDLGVRMLLGGFPCQDISISGRMSGFQGKRSCLFFEMVRIAEEGSIPWLFLENVAAIVCQSMRKVLIRVLQILHDKGYSTRYMCLCANEVGCPMYRRRWFLLARHRSADEEELRKLVPPPPSKEEWAAEVQRPWNAENKPPMEEWLLSEPTAENTGRLRMLGNSVVPQMARRALQVLVHGRPAE